MGRQNHKETLAIAKMLSTLTKQLLFTEVLQKATVTKYTCISYGYLLDPSRLCGNLWPVELASGWSGVYRCLHVLVWWKHIVYPHHLLMWSKVT